MGGQACLLYGVAEFSRDIDLAILIDADNLDSMRRVLDVCQAEPIFFPDLSEEKLQRGHACHFRCHAPESEGVRIDVMGRMRGLEPFPSLWERRIEMEVPDIGTIAVMSLPDLVLAKKTQRDKDWPMIRRLVEVDIHKHQQNPPPDRLPFWLLECRSPEWLKTLGNTYPDDALRLSTQRPLLATVHSDSLETIAVHLRSEEDLERALDRDYWRPLKAELEQWRHGRKA